MILRSRERPTQVVVSLVIPLVLLAVPFLDTTFVLLKRLKYRKPVYAADSEHFHHRLARIGFSQRKTVLLLYTWTLMLAGLPYTLLKGAVYIHPTLAEGFFALMDHVKPVD